MEVGSYPAAQVLGLPHINDLALGVLVEVHTGIGRDGADFLEKIHGKTTILDEASDATAATRAKVERDDRRIIGSSLKREAAASNKS